MPPRLRLVVLGPRRVGKTAITVRYLTQRFIGEYSSKKDHIYTSRTLVDGTTAHLEILDTCRFMSFERIDELSAWGQGFLVVFSLTDMVTLLEAVTLLRALSRHRPRLPVILLANKADLRHARSVSTKYGMEAAVSEGSLYLEVSAASEASGPELAFTALAKLILGAKKSSLSCTHFFAFVRRLIKQKEDSKTNKKFYVKETYIL